LQQRIKRPKLVQRSTIVLAKPFHLVRKALPVCAGEADVTRSDEGVIGVKLRLVALVGVKELEDLPDIEPATDHPGAAGCATKCDPRKEPHLRGLLGELLNHHAARTAGLPHLVGDQDPGLLSEPDRERLSLGLPGRGHLQCSECSECSEQRKRSRVGEQRRQRGSVDAYLAERVNDPQAREPAESMVGFEPAARVVVLRHVREGRVYKQVRI
jgi:hypothetical protein